MGTVGSPAEFVDKTLTFRETFGDYQRQLFLVDHAGLPLKTVLEQMDILGEEVVPVLRKEFDAARPAHVPEAPTHESLVARHAAGKDPIPGGGPDSQAAKDRAQQAEAAQRDHENAK